MDEAWLCEARLLAGQEKLSAGVLVAELAARLGCGDFVQAVLIKSAHNERPGASRWALLAAVFAADGVTPLPIDVDATCRAYSAG